MISADRNSFGLLFTRFILRNCENNQTLIDVGIPKGSSAAFYFRVLPVLGIRWIIFSETERLSLPEDEKDLNYSDEEASRFEEVE